mgnify:CR=1 FL=1
MGYIFLFLIGFGMAIAGGVSIIAYMNFFPAGIGWLDYFIFIKGRLECYLFPAGILLMTIVLRRYPNNRL